MRLSVRVLSTMISVREEEEDARWAMYFPRSNKVADDGYIYMVEHSLGLNEVARLPKNWVCV